MATVQEEISRFRKHSGVFGIVQNTISLILPLIGVLYFSRILEIFFRTSITPQQYVSLFLGFALFLTFISVPASPKVPPGRVPWYDVILGLVAAFACFYCSLFYPQLIFKLGLVSPFRAFLGATILLTVFEATRRFTGWTLISIALVFVLYARFTHLFPGPLYGHGLSWFRLLNYAYTGADAVFGSVLTIATTTVLAFVLFGQFLALTGGGDVFVNIAQAVMGRYRGGPAKVAIVASGLFGMISGSAVSNAACTGVVTIPLMKRIGYEPHFAGAVEAAAASGGTIMPPVMGAAAFLMASFLGITYNQVALVAFVPACLYYLGIFLQVDFRAAILGLKGIEASLLPNLRETAKEAWIYLIPLAGLFYWLLIAYLSAELSALYTVILLLAILFLQKRTRPSLAKIISIIQSTTWAALEITVVCAIVGCIVGMVSVTGLGLSLPQALISASGGHLIILLILTGIAAVILGMGLPITASYCLLVAIVVPALVQFSIPPLAAHLFVLYFAVMSFVTPPVALAAYVAAAIAGSSMWKTGWQAVRLGIAAYIVPFIFVYRPGILLMSTTWDFVWVTFITAVAVICLAAAFEGYLLFSRISWTERVIALVGACSLIFPHIVSDVIGLGLFLIVLLRLLFSVKPWSANRNLNQGVG